MAVLLDERSKRHRERASAAPTKKTPSNKGGSEDQTDLMKLVESVKRKSAAVNTGSGKRRKI